MQQPKELSTKEKIIEFTASALNKLRMPLLVLLIAFAAFIIVYLIVDEVRSKRTERSTTIVERIENDYYSWLDLESEEERESVGIDLLDRIDSVIGAYSRLYAAQRAYYIQGSLFYQTGAWEASAESFATIADKFPRSYLSPIALMNAATAAEQGDDVDQAILYLQRITEDFSSPEMPAVYFSLGRLHEAKEDYDGAIEYYERLLDEYPSSGWTNLAQTRIIGLTVDRS